MSTAAVTSAVAIDTATELLSIALICGNPGAERRYAYHADAGLRHGSNLLPALQWLLDRAGIRAADLDLIICCDGPGSFTGLRIGLATAKGLAVAAAAPLVVVPTLDALAWPHRVWPGLVVAAVDARKQRYYGALFRDGRKLSGDLDVAPDDLTALILETAMPTEPILITGPAAQQLHGQLTINSARCCGHSGAEPAANRIRRDPTARAGAAVGLLEFGLVRAQNGEYARDNHGPHYVRNSDAEMGITVPRRKAADHGAPPHRG